MKSLTTSMLVVLSRLTGELTVGKDGSMAIILALFQFICSPNLSASSRRLGKLSIQYLAFKFCLG